MSDNATNYQTTSLFDYTKNNMPDGWGKLFKRLLPIIDEISPKLLECAKSEIIFPVKMTDIYNCFRFVKPLHVRAVIIGQDPYYADENQAMGLSFSVRHGVTIPPSLKNIFTELKSEGFTISNSQDGDLTKWARDGRVLLLNSALTVKKGVGKSHTNIWTNFTPEVI